MNRPTLRQLTIFLEVYRRKSVSVAAERLHMTQAATSIALRQLEAQLGGLLFNRTTRRLTSTPLADQLAPLAERMLEDLRRIEALTRTAEHSVSRVAIACTPTFAAYFLPDLMRSIHEHFPNVHIDVIDVSQSQFIPTITSRQADFGLGFIGFEDPELRQIPLVDDHLCFVSAVGSAHLPPEISWRELQHRPVAMISRSVGIRPMIEQACARAGIRLNVTHEVNLLSTALSLASAGVTNTIAPQQIVHLSGIRGLESSVLHGPRVKRHVSAILSCHHPLEHWPRQVLEHCVAYYEGLTQKTDGTGTGSTP